MGIQDSVAARAPTYVDGSRPIGEDSSRAASVRDATERAPVRGVTDNEIRLGISAPFTRSAKELGIQMKIGIETAFNLSLKQKRDYLGLQQSAAHIDWNQRDAL